MKVVARLIVEDDWEADSLEAAQADAEELAKDIRKEHMVAVTVESVREES